MKKILKYFTVFEWLLWICSMGIVVISYVAFGRSIDLSFISSLIGATALIFTAKANPIGPVLMVVFSIIYGYISYTFSYFGEMLTYLGMTLPMAVFSIVEWLKNPFKGKKSEVEVNNIGKTEMVFMLLGSVAVTVVFYFVLKYFNTANLLISTFSVTTSFVAAYFTLRRSPYYALAYALNDIVLIVMWTLATFKDTYYLSVVICFLMFLVNDSYGFINWRRIEKRQTKSL